MTTSTGRRTISAARGWHAFVAVVATAVLLLQLYLTLTRGDDTAAIRLARLVSYFTVESNILVAVVSWLLFADPARDGRGFRIFRLASVVFIAVTGLVYATVLAPLYDFTGLALVTDTGFHYVVPALAVLGWALFGPRPRVDLRTIGLALLFPVVYLAFTLVRGAATGWYPYPFLDAAAEGYARVAVNSVLITLAFLVVCLLVLAADRRLPAAPRGLR